MAPRYTFTHARDTPDLAAIVLAEPEPRANRLPGYDARSVLLLVLVVAALAAVVVGTMSVASGSDGPTAARADAKPSALASLDATDVTTDGAASTAQAAATVAPTAPLGIALGIGRITATPDRLQGALVVRVAVTNTGTDALVASSGAQLLVLIDDRVIGATSLGALDARQGRVVASVSTYDCTPGRHAVTAIADATSRVRHALGSDVARSAELTVTCPG